MRALLAAMSIIIILLSALPYARDVVRGRVSPNRSTRIMFFVLLLVATLQQHQLGTGLALSVLVAEFVTAAGLLGLSFNHGVGGLTRFDVGCYILLGLDVVLWLTTPYVLIALLLTMVADCIGFAPTVVKTWYKPSSETPLFYWAGVVAPLLAIAAEAHITLVHIAYPLFLVFANGFELLLIYGQHQRRKK
jgi:hypothetical protein